LSRVTNPLKEMETALTRRVAAVRVLLGAGILALPLLASCDGDQEATPSTPAGLTVSPSPTAVSSPADPKQVAAAGAVAGYKRWVAGIYRMQASGGKNVSMLPAISVGTQLVLDRSQARQLGQESVHAQTPARVLWARAVTSGAGAGGTIVHITVTACQDVSVARWVDANGHSAVIAGRPPRLVDTAEMRLVGATWKAALVTNKQAKSC